VSIEPVSETTCRCVNDDNGVIPRKPPEPPFHLSHLTAPPSSLPLPLPAHLTTLPVRLRQRTDIVPQQTSAQTCRNRTACMREHMVQVLPSPHTHTLSLSLSLTYLGPLMICTAPHHTKPTLIPFLCQTHTHIYTICNAMQSVRLASAALEQKTQVYAQTTIIGMGPRSSKRGWGCAVLTD
jgi:hypothetical protein